MVKLQAPRVLFNFVGLFSCRMRTEQTEELVKKASEGGADPLEKLGLKELMTRLKRCAENTKSSMLREHALGVIASMLRHRCRLPTPCLAMTCITFYLTPLLLFAFQQL